MRVCVKKCRTPEEELEHLEVQLECVGNFFSCDAHPNQIKACDISISRFWEKRAVVLNSLEFKYDQE